MDALFPLSEVSDTLSGAQLSACGTYRYTLERVWDASLPVAVYIMLNPSTADASVDDNTIRRCRWFAEREGYGGITVVNLFALRSTDPAALRDHAAPIGPQTDRWICTVLCQDPGVVIAAWGAHAFAAGRAVDVLRTIAAHDVPVKCLGTTKDGHPKHPLYLAKATPLIDYDPRRGA